MLSISSIDSPRKKTSPRSIEIDLQLQKARQLEQTERDKKNDGYCYIHNPVLAEAKKSYQSLAIKEKNAEAQYRLAEIYFIEGDLPAAYESMQMAAEQKHMMALCRLGEFYLYGYGVERNEPKAVECFVEAENCSSGRCPRALMHVGAILCLRPLNERDIELGKYYLKEAKRLYPIHAARALEIPEILKEAELLKYEELKKAKEFSKAEELLNSEELKYFGKDLEDFYLKLNPSQIIPTALFQLYKIYVHRDKEKSLACLEFADKAGHPLAKLMRGKAITSEILKNLVICASEKCADSAHALGKIYAKTNEYLDIKTAIIYYTQAADAGHTEAALEIGKLFFSENDYSLAEKYLLQAVSDKQDVEIEKNAAYELYKIYEAQHISHISTWSYVIDYHAKAMSYCKIAAERGHPEAKRIIAKSKKPQRLSVSDPIVSTKPHGINALSKSDSDLYSTELSNFAEKKAGKK